MLHLLLVEDSPSDVLLIREALRRCSIPADVTIAYDGEQALAALANFHPDLIVLDLNLPKLSGIDVLKSFKNNSNIPIAVFSGSDNPADRKQVLDLGANEYLTKPPDFDGYMRAISDILMRRWGPGEPTEATSTQI